MRILSSKYQNSKPETSAVHSPLAILSEQFEARRSVCLGRTEALAVLERLQQVPLAMIESLERAL